MISKNEIKPEARVICSNYVLLGVVDHLEGAGTIKLKRDDAGRHHFIPLEWVTSVDDQVHVGVSSDQAVEAWTDDPEEDAAPERSLRVAAEDYHAF